MHHFKHPPPHMIYTLSLLKLAHLRLFSKELRLDLLYTIFGL